VVEGTGSKQYAVALVNMASEFYTKTRALFKGFVGVRSLFAIRGAGPRRFSEIRNGL